MSVTTRRTSLAMVMLVFLILVAGTLSTQIALAAQEEPATPTPTLEPTVAPTETPLAVEEQSSADTSPTTTSDSTEKKALDTPVYDWTAIGLAGAALALLAYLFYLVFRYSHRLEQTSYLGHLYQDALASFDIKVLTAKIDNRWKDYYYHRLVENKKDWLQGHPKPHRPSFEDWDPQAVVVEPDESAAEKQASKLKEPEEAYNKLKEQEEAYNKWQDDVDTEARRLYQEELTKAMEESEKRIAKTTIDIGTLMGHGGSRFILEFTAIVVIIFTALVLGILGVMNTEQIGTLLAAIAGYVLGRSTTRTQTAEGVKTETSTPPSTEALAELVKVLSARPPDQAPTISISEPVITGQQIDTADSSISLTGKATDDNQVSEVVWTNVSTGVSGKASLGGGTTTRTWQVAEVGLNPGINTVSVFAKDGSGNSSEVVTFMVNCTSEQDEAGINNSANSQVKPDDLTRTEGIGPKISEILKESGIDTFAQLAGTDVDELRTLLTNAGLHGHDPLTWPEQAQLAADGKWDELDKLQAELRGGRQHST